MTFLVHVEQVMGTVVSLRAELGGSSESSVRAAIAQAVTLLHRHDELFSLYSQSRHPRLADAWGDGSRGRDLVPQAGHPHPRAHAHGS